MNKILKYSIFIFIVFLGFNSNVFGVTTTKKNFCDEKQGYMYPCDQVKMQCNYSRSKDGSRAYVNVSHSGNARASEQFWDDENKTWPSKEINNWGQKEKVSVYGKQIYEKTGECPKYLIEIWGFYVSDDSHLYQDLKTLKNSNEDLATLIENNDVYELKSITTNTYDPIKESEKKDEESEYPDVENCAGFKSEETCKVGKTAENGNYGCVWNDDYTDLNNKGKGFCSPSGLLYLSCGSGDAIAYDIPVMAPRLTAYAITALKTVTPVILIIMGMFQLIKAITSQNEDEMKKAKSSLIKKVIAAVIIFFMVSIVQFVVSKVADTKEQESLSSCLSCFLNNDCGKNYYYTDGYGNCYNISNNKKREHCPVEHY